MMSKAIEVGTLIAEATMPSDNVRSFDVIRYDSELAAFECADISDLASSLALYCIPKNTNIGTILLYSNIRSGYSKVDDTHFTVSNYRTGQNEIDNTLCVVPATLVLPIGTTSTDTIEYRLEYEGYNNATAYYHPGPYSQLIDTSNSVQPSGNSNKAYWCKKSVWFSLKWTGNNYTMIVHKSKQIVYKVGVDNTDIVDGVYTDETTRALWGTPGSVPPEITITCFGYTKAKLFQL